MLNTESVPEVYFHFSTIKYIFNRTSAQLKCIEHKISFSDFNYSPLVIAGYFINYIDMKIYL